jgi:hypothetical protein
LSRAKATATEQKTNDGKAKKKVFLSPNNLNMLASMKKLAILAGRAYLLFSHSIDELRIGRLGQHAAELRSVIVDEADVLYDYVVHFPVASGIIQTVNDREFLTLVIDQLGGHLGKIFIHSLF